MTTLTDLIKSAERKIADPKTTPQTAEREKAIAHHLTSMQNEIEIKESALAGYRKENMMLYTENKIQREALETLRAENTKLYADLCEMGDMARERSRMRRGAVIGIDLAGGVDYTVDTLIRHKWPEEKPDSLTYVLIRRMNFFGEPRNHVAWYTKDGEFHVSGYDEPVDDITHWWNLPEVGNE